MSPLTRLRGWLQATHPFPLVMVVSLTGLVGLASAGGQVDAGRFVFMLAAMFCSQLAIGWTNDYIDRDSDAIHQPVKPIPTGLVNAAHLPPAIALAVAISFATGAALGLVPLAFLITGTAAGLSYDLVLKDTRLSPLAFVVAFAVLLPFVWSSLDIFRGELLGLYIVGAPLTVAAHIANVLPDIESDAAAGRINLAVVLGRAPAQRLLYLSLLLTPVLLGVSLALIHYDIVWLVATLAVYAALVTTALIAYRRARREADVWGFRCVVLACVLFAAGWLAAV